MIVCRTSKGFTLVEVVICIAIIALVVAIATPVFVRVKHAAQITHSMSNLDQMFVAGKMYQMEWEGDGQYGDLAQMGLPSAAWPTFTLLDLAGKPAKSPCGLNPYFNDAGEDNVVHHYFYRPGDGGERFAKYSLKWRENMVFFSDVNCDDHSVPLHSPFFEHRGLAVYLSGQAVNILKKGDVADDYWWGEPAE